MISVAAVGAAVIAAVLGGIVLLLLSIGLANWLMAHADRQAGWTRAQARQRAGRTPLRCRLRGHQPRVLGMDGGLPWSPVFAVRAECRRCGINMTKTVPSAMVITRSDDDAGPPEERIP